jgi:hypothetical protein
MVETLKTKQKREKKKNQEEKRINKTLMWRKGYLHYNHDVPYFSLIL